MPDEPSAAMAGTMAQGGPPGQSWAMGMGRRSFPVGANFDLKIPGLESTTQSLGQMTQALEGLKEALKSISSNKYFLKQGIDGLLDNITQKATQTAAALGGVTGQVSGLGNAVGAIGGGSSTAGLATYGSYRTPAGGGWHQAAIASAGSAIGGASGAGGGGGGGGAGGDMLGALLGGGGGGGMLSMIGDMAMFPLRFLRQRIQTNRESALYMSQALGGTSFATGLGNSQLFANLVNMPGGMMGTPQDLMQALASGRQAGAFYGAGGMQGGEAMQGPRAGGFYRSITQLQAMNPGIASGTLAQQLGQQVSNVGSQQMGAFMTSGAFAMVGRGGKMKTVQEWAESILRWLEGQRPGRDRGKAFKHGELLAQYFPGSNIDAWMEINGISPDMREYFWTYALGKAQQTGGTGGPFEDWKITGGNIAFERLRAQTQFTRSEVGLAGRMGGQYANRETMNRWFNALMGNIENRIIPNMTKPGQPLGMMAMMPDFIEDLLFGLMENMGPLGTILGGAIGWGSVAQSGAGGIMGQMPVPSTGFTGPGNVGDLEIGDYGPMGGTTTAGMNLDVRRKVNTMMQANPKLHLNSGMRDRSTQMRLRRKGVGKVSGRPSAHTRGEAADMGPPSEYSWLAANAGKFGLRSGAAKGEPWHVGVGDEEGGGILENIPFIGGALDTGMDILRTVADFFGGVIDLIKRPFDLLKGGVSGMLNVGKLLSGGITDPAAFMGENIGSFLNLLFGSFGAGAKAEGVTHEFDPGLASRLPRNITLGGAMKEMPLYVQRSAAAGGISPGGGGGAGATPTGTNQQIGQQMAAAMGWTGAEWTALQELWTRESHWNERADNPSSSAYGIPQALPGSKMASAGADWQTNPATQIRWGLDYIKNRYGSPSAALAHHDRKNWYAGGAWSTDNETAHLHQGEMVLPATIAENVRGGLREMGVSDLGIGDLGTAYARMMPMQGARLPAPMVFQNSFNIQGGVGTQIDMRRTVMLMADHLEAEMKRRSARSN